MGARLRGHDGSWQANMHGQANWPPVQMSEHFEMTPSQPDPRLSFGTFFQAFPSQESPSSRGARPSLFNSA